MIKIGLIIILTAILSITVVALPGTLDTTFGVNGMVTFFGNSQDQFGNAVAVQPNGKIVVAGGIGNLWDREIILLRLNADGSPDTNFGINGMVRTQVGTSSDASSIAFQKNGKIVVGGGSNIGAHLIRYNYNGSIDQTFGANGITYAGGVSINGIAIDKDGLIYAVGSKYTGVTEFLVQRFRYNGTLDTYFGTGGTVNIGFPNAEASSVDLMPDGKIAVAGWIDNGNDTDFAIIKLNEDGIPDRSFGGFGIVSTDISGYDRVFAVAFGPNGRIYAAGASGSPSKMTVVGYMSDGSLDPAFRTGGILSNRSGIVTTISGSANAIEVERTGQILIAGVDEVSSNKLIVQKLNSDGSFARWGKKGSAYANFGSSTSSGKAMALISGSLFVAGTVRDPNIIGAGVAIAKFNN